MSFALISALTAQIVSQFLVKGAISCCKNHRFSLGSFKKSDYGGMPSGHSALVSGIIFYLIFKEGFSDLASVALVSGSIVIVDSFRLRYDIQKALKNLGNQVYGSEQETPYNTNLGHTLAEVAVGITIGIISGAIWYWFSLL